MSPPSLAIVVNPMGGDGTVRAVASVLRGTKVPLSLLPSGTGNLLARNLGIPVNSLQTALEVAFKGPERAIDIGLATFDDGQERVFVMILACNCGSVMGNIGLATHAAPDDGVLEALLMRPRGITGWTVVLLDLATRHRKGNSAMLQWPGKEIGVHLDSPALAEVDGTP
jgi:diacylglycerol kinase (ATP)